MQGVSGSAVRNTGCSSGGQEFRSQQPHQATPSGLRLQLEGLQRPLLDLQHILTQKRQTSRFLKRAMRPYFELHCFDSLQGT
ncbi:rCG61349 [Rattus norvegicus]|uniref:RCG61349 n=1 Tax=Rattus norvegicus TaxID=10116 RepID=A6HA44_RAT|nr:rCG61349 [Rattus norvegicus]